MNRREFLQSIAAFATTVAIPFDVIATAPESVIDQVWTAVNNDPVTFYVKNYGTLTASAIETYPSSRAELLGMSEIGTFDELSTLANDEWRVASLIEDAMADEAADNEEEGNSKAFDDWQAWLGNQDDDTIEYLIRQANDWINDSPDEFDWEFANRHGYTNQGSAFTFFRDDFEYCDELNIVIIEGDCPGSSYFGAELRMDVDEANALAEELDIPIRFAWQED